MIEQHIKVIKKYFTSCDPHHDIYTFSYWQISPGILSDVSSGILSGILSGISSGISSGILINGGEIPSGRWGNTKNLINGYNSDYNPS